MTLRSSELALRPERGPGGRLSIRGDRVGVFGTEGTGLEPPFIMKRTSSASDQLHWCCS